MIKNKSVGEEDFVFTA